MKKSYYVDIYFCPCPDCKQQTVGKTYFHVYDRDEIARAKRAGSIDYRCIKCGYIFRSNQVLTNGDIELTSREEAEENGIAYSSPRRDR